MKNLRRNIQIFAFILLGGSYLSAQADLPVINPSINMVNATGCLYNPYTKEFNKNVNPIKTIYTFINPDGKKSYHPVLSGINISLGQNARVPSTIIPYGNDPVIIISESSVSPSQGPGGGFNWSAQLFIVKDATTGMDVLDGSPPAECFK